VTQTSSTATPSAATLSALARVGIVVAAIIAASAVNAVIALITLALGADDSFNPLQPGAYIFLTVIGVLLGLAGWAVVRKVSADPARVLRVLVPVVVVLSFIPDFTTVPGMEGSSGLGIAALVLMHVATAAIAVPAFARALPVR
jgi:hypothetical protein